MHNQNEKVIEEINIIPERSEGLSMPHTGYLCYTMVFYDDYRDVLHADGSTPEGAELVHLSIHVDYEKAFEKEIPITFKRTETLLIAPPKDRDFWIMVNVNKGLIHEFHHKKLTDGETFSFDTYYKNEYKQFNFKYLKDLKGREFITK